MQTVVSSSSGHSEFGRQAQTATSTSGLRNIIAPPPFSMSDATNFSPLRQRLRGRHRGGSCHPHGSVLQPTEKHWQFGIGRKARGSELRCITRCVTVRQTLVSRDATGYSDCLVDSHPRKWMEAWEVETKHGLQAPS